LKLFSQPAKNTIKFHTFEIPFYKFMFLKNILFLVIIISLLSCNKSISKKNREIVRDSLISNTSKLNHPIVKLSNKAKILVTTWDEYQNMDELIKQYQNISASLALLNAKELSVLARQLKDSIHIEKLNIPSVKIRLHVLHNETLRLADMETIPSITESEVSEENENILNAYSALNLKINNIVSQENLNEQVSSFVDEVLKLGDTLKKVDTNKIPQRKK